MAPVPSPRNWAFLCLGALALAANPARAQATVEDLAHGYLQTVRQGDWEAAAALWLPADLAASRRLGVAYQGVPFKLDSASPLVLQQEGIRAGAVRVTLGGVDQVDRQARIRFDLVAAEQSASFTCHAVQTGGLWRLANPATALAEGWPRRESEFLELHVQPPRVMAPAAVARLDRFIAETCGRLGVPEDRIALLRERKIRYYLCDEATVAAIVGAATRGAALLQTDAVVTSEPCHLHELAHLLVNFALQELPLYTLPALQEGAAVALGGRWGRAPAVMQGPGKFSLQSGMARWDEFLAWRDFQQQPADWTYAPSGVLVGFLLEILGGEDFLALYRQLSGDLSDLQRWDRYTLEGRICAAAGLDRAAIQDRLLAHVERLSCGGVLPAGGLPDPAEDLWRAEGVRVTPAEDDRWLQWEIAVGKAPFAGAVLLHGQDPGPQAETSACGESRLFCEQFPDRRRAGEQVALIFSAEEVGVYDFRTDLLEAKYVAGFCPDQALLDPNGAVLRFRIRRELLPPAPWRAELVRRSG